MVFLANPNNPTGSYLTRTSWRACMPACRDDVLLVIDAAYAEYVGATTTRPARSWSSAPATWS